MTVPGLSIRAAEQSAVLAALEANGFEGVEPKDASAVLKVAMEAVLARDWWLVVFRTEEGLELPQGLFATGSSAIKMVEENRLGGLDTWQVGIVHINNAEKQLERVRVG